MRKSTKKSSNTANAASTDTPKRYKIVILGGGGVGKSCLTLRMVYNSFQESYDPTIEDSYRKDNFKVDDEICPIEILDTAGQDEMASMRDLYYKQGDGFLFVYSITASTSLDELQGRFESLLLARGCTQEDCPPIILVGNKCDLEKDRIVSSESAKNFLRNVGNQGHVMETSAKANINVEKMFENIVRLIKQRDLEQIAKSKGKAGGGKTLSCILI